MNRRERNMGINPKVFLRDDDADDKGYHCGREPLSR
ncbi:MAG: hypothetical protein RL357_1535 [Pseudomonadota bacterium]|jgi:hypothetical protein